MLDFKTSVINASQKINKYLEATPLIYSSQLSLLTQAKVYLKLETIQPTCSFKVRGAFNKLLSLSAKEKRAGVVAASTGNHGAAVAYGCNKLGIDVVVFVPKTASLAKVSTIKNYGATIEFYGDECGEAEKHARAYAKDQGKVYISPYNDTEVIIGQGTIGFELLQQNKNIDVVFASVGGGGLISGLGGYLKVINKNIMIVGCLPENSPVMLECIKANKIIELENKPTLSDATAGNMDLDSITFEFNQRFVDTWSLASEAEIQAAMRFMLEKEHLVVEGSVGVAVACLLKSQEKYKNKTVVVIVSGANVSIDVLKKVVCQ